MIRFSTVELMDEQKCDDDLVEILHPKGLCCPACETPVEHAKVHRRDRAPVLYFRLPAAGLTTPLPGRRGKAPIIAAG